MAVSGHRDLLPHEVAVQITGTDSLPLKRGLSRQLILWRSDYLRTLEPFEVLAHALVVALTPFMDTLVQSHNLKPKREPRKHCLAFVFCFFWPSWLFFFS